MTCDDVRKQLALLLYGELDFDQEEALEQHLEGCARCGSERRALEAFHRLADEGEAELPSGLLESCRSDLKRKIAAEPAPSSHGWLAGVRSWNLWSWPVVALAWRPALALGLVAAGFFAARMTAPVAGPSVAARQIAALPDPVASRVRFVEPEAGGRVQIVLEETRQRKMSGRLEDEPIRRLLLAAAVDREDPGLRVESIDILKSQSSSAEVRRALLTALRSDPNPGVRLKAIEGLRAFAGEAETRKTLAQTVLSDDNSNVRTMAIELLVQHKEQDVIGVLQQLLRKERDGYIRSRSEEALRAMRASVETF